MNGIERKLERLIGESCRDGEIGDIRSILDAEFESPSVLEFQEIYRFVLRKLKPDNDFGVNPSSLAFDTMGWYFRDDDDGDYKLVQVNQSEYDLLPQEARHATKLANGKWAYFKYEY